MAKKQTKTRADPLPKELFDILACPMCKVDLRYSSDKKWLICTKCAKKYPIKGKIPVLLPR